LCKRPGVARVAAAEDNLDTADLRSGAQRFDHISRRIDFDLDAQMPFDPGNRIDNDALIPHG
jgi:hypothetical protein